MRKSLFAVWIMAAVLMMTGIPSQGAPAGAPRPYGLMTDLIERTDVVYEGGYPTGMSLLESGLSGRSYQFAAIATPRPRLSWIVPWQKFTQDAAAIGSCPAVITPEMVERDVLQTAWQVRVYRFEKRTAIQPARGAKQYEYPVPDTLKTLIWDSGRVESSQSTAVIYGGPALEPDTVYGWEVKLWVRPGGECGWSDLKLFRTAPVLNDFAVSYEPLVKRDERPKMVKELPDGATLVDFGKAAFGQLKLTLQGGREPRTVVLHLGERLKDGRVDRKPFGTCRYRRIELTVLPGLQTYSPAILPDWRNTHGDAVLMPDYIGEVLPFRYLEIEGLPYPLPIGEDGVNGAPVRAQDIVRVMVSYPVSGSDAVFDSKDPILNQVWDLCRYSMVATSFIGYHIDGDRERIPYECDALINQLGWYGVDRSYTLSRRTIDYLLDHPTWPTEWILQTVLMAWYDYLYTGDTRLLEARYELLQNHTLADLRQPNGLVSTRVQPQSQEFLQGIRRTQPIRDIVDWPQGKGSFGLPGSSPGEADFFEFGDYNAVVNAYHYATLCCMEQIAGALGKQAEKERWAQDADRFRSVYNKLFRDKKTGLYRDGLDSQHAALHSNMFPLAFGLVPVKQVPDVAAYIAGKGMACSIANAKFLLDALYEAGDADSALALLNATHDRSWYNTIRAGSTISFEAWDDKYKGNQDWNHAWGAAPADLLPHKFLGVEPLEPGWSRIRVRPQVASVQKATGVIPTVKGSVFILVDQSDGGYHLTLQLPANTSTRIEIPVKTCRKGIFSLDGNEIRAARQGSFWVLDSVGSGYHVLENSLR